MAGLVLCGIGRNPQTSDGWPLIRRVSSRRALRSVRLGVVQRLDSQHRPRLVIRRHVHQAVGSLLDVADALVQLGQQRDVPHRQVSGDSEN